MSTITSGLVSGGPLRSRNFRLLLTCDVISVAGSAVAFVSLPFAVLRIGGSPSDVGYVATAQLIPVIAFLLLGGVVADRLPRQRVIVATNAAQALAQGGSATLILVGQAKVWQLAVLASVGGVAFGFYSPAARGLLPQTVPDNQLSQANALDRTCQSTAEIGGAGLGGLLIGLAGPGWGLVIDAVSFAIAGALATDMRFPALPPIQATGILHDLRDGWHEFASRRWLWVVVILFAVLVGVSAGTINVIGPLVAHSSLAGARSWGFIVAGYSAGSVVGGLVMLKFQPRRMLLAAISAVPAFALLQFALAVPLVVPLDLIAACLAGGCLEVYGVSWAVTLQQEIPPDKLSRVASYDTLGNYALMPIGTAIAGPLAVAFGTSAVLACGGALVVLLPLLVLLVPEVRHLRRDQPTAEDPASVVEGAGSPGTQQGRVHGS